MAFLLRLPSLRPGRQVVDVDLHRAVFTSRADARRVGDAPGALVLAYRLEVRDAVYDSCRQDVFAVGDSDAKVLALRVDERVPDELHIVGHEARPRVALAEWPEGFQAADGMWGQLVEAGDAVDPVWVLAWRQSFTDAGEPLAEGIEVVTLDLEAGRSGVGKALFGTF